MAQRLPRTLLGGRVRTSTVGLAVAFAVVLTVYLLVRPVPVATVSVTNPDGSTSLYLSPSATPPATTAPPSEPRTTTPAPTVTSRPTSTAPTSAPTATTTPSTPATTTTTPAPDTTAAPTTSAAPTSTG